jgi:ribosomal protein S18 acetylase RimI-like enzyme
MNVEIGPLSRPRVRAASLLLARAFADDGILTHYLARRRGRRIAIPAFFCAVIHERLATTYAATAGPELVGVLSCAGPDEPRAHLGARIRARSRLLQVQALFPRSSRQLLAGFRSMERLRPPQPHWYLAFAAVEPALQGQGIGDALLRPVLQQADSRCPLLSRDAIPAKRRRSSAAWDSRSSPNRARSKMRGRSGG